nr:MAG TPA: Head Tail Connector Protein [Caudoviricetes sp.]
MALTSYADASYYRDQYGGRLPDEEAEKAVFIASRHIDSMTFNRIVGKGFGNLTEFQKEMIRYVACKQADFEKENEPLINSILSSYSLNGVSMGIDTNGWNVTVRNGVVMQADTYSMLEQTGLCCRRLGAV